MIDGLGQSEFIEAEIDPKSVIGCKRPKPFAGTGNSGNVFGF